MTMIGKVQNGTIVLPPGVELPEGARVSVRILTPTADPISAPENPQQQASFHEGLMRFAGIVKDMPSDYSVNHDHYLYGTPKTSP